MVTAVEHYETFLGDIYAWMVGGVDEAMSQGAEEVAAILSGRDAAGIAVDLGAGFGTHSVPLAEAGFSVIAVDSCAALLNYMDDHRARLPIQTVHADLEDFPSHCPAKAQLICCMGDTITHLPRKQSVRDVVRNARLALNSGGQFVVSLRDYDKALEGTDRFISVRSDEHRILTCALEYQKGSVAVNDILHEFSDGHWVQSISSYYKLRLPIKWIEELMRSEGFEVKSEPGLAGMVRIIGIAE